MQADFSIELGADDPTLAIPWESPDGVLRYYDLKLRPELLLNVEEAILYPELGELLANVNSERSTLRTAKCDAWFTSELGEDELIYGAAGKFGGYVDLFFDSGEARASLETHRVFATQLSGMLARAPELPSAFECSIRRAHFSGLNNEEPSSEPQEGFYFTCYIFGYGDDLEESRRNWAVALKLVENALLQLAGRR